MVIKLLESGSYSRARSSRKKVKWVDKGGGNGHMCDCHDMVLNS